MLLIFGGESTQTKQIGEFFYIYNFINYFIYRYRADKGGFFITAQVIVSVLTGEIYSVILGKGRNNDQAMFNMTNIGEFIEQKALTMLGDKGYHHHRIIRPDEGTQEENHSQMSLRSIVELVIGMTKHWECCNQCFRNNPEMQELVIMIVFNLVNEEIKRYPISFTQIEELN